MKRAIIVLAIIANILIFPETSQGLSAPELDACLAQANSDFRTQSASLSSGTLISDTEAFSDLQNRDQYVAQSIELGAFRSRLLKMDVVGIQATVSLALNGVSAIQGGSSLNVKKETVLTFSRNGAVSTDSPYFTDMTIDCSSDVVGVHVDRISVNSPTASLAFIDDLNFKNSDLDSKFSFPRIPRSLPPQDPGSLLSSARRVLVAQHALMYANSFDPKYDVYTSDCTNFASQALEYAGWATVGSGSAWQSVLTNYWGYWANGTYPNVYTTNTWSVADDLFTFGTSRGRLSVISTYPNLTVLSHQDELVVGDLIFVHWDSTSANTGSVKNHVMVVTGKSNGTIYISQHTNSRLNIALSESRSNAIADRQPYTHWTFVHS